MCNGRVKQVLKVIAGKEKKTVVNAVVNLLV